MSTSEPEFSPEDTTDAVQRSFEVRAHPAPTREELEQSREEIVEAIAWGD